MAYVCNILIVGSRRALMWAIRQSAWGETATMALVEVEELEPVFGEVLVRVVAAG
ncbi:hypothetical protein GCM10022224_075360 [Nonomuraea antimicrobica]|uniref:Uncharacterized protein n=1 Tax=Nonomuraea antimicrobica TaxID=561173 RepID=A0ABP7D2A2_9ACTN